MASASLRARSKSLSTLVLPSAIAVCRRYKAPRRPFSSPAPHLHPYPARVQGRSPAQRSAPCRAVTGCDRWGKTWIFMDINTNGMAGVMPELRAVTCTFNHGTCGAIDLMTGNAGADGINGRLLCRQNDLVHRIERVLLRRRVLPGDKKVLVISEQYPRCWAPKSG